MANRGRPRVIDPKAREMMIGLVGMGCSRRRAARHAGVSRSALYLALREDEHFATQMRLAEMQKYVAPLRTIMDQSRTSWRAGAWLMGWLQPRGKPNLVSKADCMAFLRSVLADLPQAEKDMDNQIEDRLKRLDQLLMGRADTTPRGRRVAKELKREDENGPAPPTATPSLADLSQEERENCCTTPGPNCPSSPTNQPPIEENAAFDDGAGI